MNLTMADDSKMTLVTPSCSYWSTGTVFHVLLLVLGELHCLYPSIHIERLTRMVRVELEELWVESLALKELDSLDSEVDLSLMISDKASQS